MISTVSLRTANPEFKSKNSFSVGSFSQVNGQRKQVLEWERPSEGSFQGRRGQDLEVDSWESGLGALWLSLSLTLQAPGVTSEGQRVFPGGGTACCRQRRKSTTQLCPEQVVQTCLWEVYFFPWVG